MPLRCKTHARWGRSATLQHASRRYFAIFVGGDWSWSNASLVHMEKDLCRRLVPHPKRGGSLATALSATPAPLRFVDVQVLASEWMSFRARLGGTNFGGERGVEQLVGVAKAHDSS
jgi:hypothetical protein